MLKYTYTLIVEKDKDENLLSKVVELPDCSANAKSMDKLVEKTRKKISLFLKTAKDKKIYSKFVGFQQIGV